jgi:hypothetical protein
LEGREDSLGFEASVLDSHSNLPSIMHAERSQVEDFIDIENKLEAFLQANHAAEGRK